ncbi:uncharacterized protein V1518DRAFT_428322 [Limtongia smithiae]|uniref:uncharacterized protein n=1 Tax=Limtongia smithiae TaxID=1125753 RepID=UPI0034CE6AB3
MSIAPLPPATVRTLSSTQVLLTPLSIAKELIDNALDACATNVLVELDGTTVAHLLVRDNGDGVSRNGDDRDLMCVRHATSKIEGLEDLQRDGGVGTFGFRGEALASLAEVAGKLEITTRTSLDIAAEKWRVSKAGARLDVKTVPSPIGTTVEASMIFHAIPVRKQMYIKSSKKTITAMRTMLIALCLLHRGLRISFKISRSPAVPTTYMGGNTLKDAVASCVSREAATTSVFINNEYVDDHGAWQIEAVLPKPDSSNDGVSVKNVVFAVDSRLLSNTLHTAKTLLKVAKQYITSSHKYLLFCNIRTPRDRLTYDVNVEPGKDDVLFFDEEFVMGKWTEVLQGIYATDEEETLGDGKEDEVNTSRMTPGRPDTTWTSSHDESSKVLHSCDDNVAGVHPFVDLERASDGEDVPAENDVPAVTALSSANSKHEHEEHDRRIRPDDSAVSFTPLRFGWGSEVETSDEEQEAPESSSPVRLVHVHSTRSRPRINTRIATVPRGSLVPTGLEALSDSGNEEDHEPDAEEPIFRQNNVDDSGTPPRRSGLQTPPRKRDGRQTNSPHKNRQKSARVNLISAYPGVTLLSPDSHRTAHKSGKGMVRTGGGRRGLEVEKTPAGEETHCLLVRIDSAGRVRGPSAAGAGGGVVFTGGGDGSAPAGEMAALRKEVFGLGVYFDLGLSSFDDQGEDAVTPMIGVLKDEGALKRGLYQLIEDAAAAASEESERQLLRTQVARTNLFRGERDWMMLA